MKTSPLTFIAVLSTSPVLLQGQTVFTPGGIVGASTTENVGVGVSSPSFNFETTGTSVKFARSLVGGFSGGDYDSIGYNFRPTATSGVYNYHIGDRASMLQFYYGGFRFLGAPEGSPNNAVPFQEYMRIREDGKIGIGTASPLARLDVVGPAVFEGWIAGRNSAGGALHIFGSSQDQWGKEVTIRDGRLGVGLTGPATPLHVVGGPPMTAGWNKTLTLQAQYPVQIFNSNNSRWAAIGYDYSSDFVIWVEGTSDDVNGTGSRALSIKSDRTVSMPGKVGIGTYNPQAPLHVNGHILFNDATAAFKYGVGRFDHDGLAVTGAFANGDYGASAVSLGFYKNGGSVADPKLVVLPSGNVGIGTSTPSEKLVVKGAIVAEEIRCQTTGADYVFADDYTLKPLSEVEQHIKQHKHLPGIPSAAEMQANGVGLAELQTKLLAKIEELTLHQIAQQKRLDDQAARIATLERENAALRR